MGQARNAEVYSNQDLHGKTNEAESDLCVKAEHFRWMSLLSFTIKGRSSLNSNFHVYLWCHDDYVSSYLDKLPIYYEYTGTCTWRIMQVIWLKGHLTKY